MVWDPEFAYRLHIVCESGEYLQYTWAWTTNRSPDVEGENAATVAVIDGSEFSRSCMTWSRSFVI